MKKKRTKKDKKKRAKKVETASVQKKSDTSRSCSCIASITQSTHTSIHLEKSSATNVGEKKDGKNSKEIALMALRRLSSISNVLQQKSSTNVSPRRKPTSTTQPSVTQSNSKCSTPKKPSKAKKLTSQPIREQSLKDLAAKALQKREPKEGPKSVNEDSYPRPRKSKGKKNDCSQESEAPRISAAFLFTEKSSAALQLRSKSTELSTCILGGTLPSTGLPMVQGNYDNNGRIIVNEQPFWVTQLPVDDSEQAHVMNATLLIDVLENRIKLVPMPDIEIEFDPMKEITEIAAQDQSCFTEDVLFGNTVRSMVNLNEFSVRTLSIKNRKKAVKRVGADELKQLSMKEPTIKHTYYRTTYQRFDVIPFKPSLQKLTQIPNDSSLFPTVAHVG